MAGAGGLGFASLVGLRSDCLGFGYEEVRFRGSLCGCVRTGTEYLGWWALVGRE